jgi:hypothetical protein
MRRLITLISAGRDRTIVIRRELPRTRDAGWVARPYRIKHSRILLSASPRPVTGTVALRWGVSSKENLNQTKPAIPASQQKGCLHRRRAQSRPSGREPKGSLDGWRRCETIEEEGMAGIEAKRPSAGMGISLRFGPRWPR